MEAGTEHLVGEGDLHSCIGIAKELQAGTKVNIEWSHDYVTVGGSSGPDRPVKKLTVLQEPM